MNVPVIQIVFKNNKDLERVPAIYIKSMEDMINLNNNSYDALEKIRIELINLVEHVKSLQGHIRYPKIYR